MDQFDRNGKENAAMDLKYKYVVKVDGAWLGQGEGDPCRTLNKNFAMRYKTESAAKAAITRAKKTHPLIDREYSIEPL